MTIRKSRFFLKIVFAVLLFVVVPVSNAQEAPELMVTWRANSYIPPSYRGKALPIVGTEIEMALELIDNGKLADISENEIRWLINNRTLQSGKGLKQISFVAGQFRSEEKMIVTVTRQNGSRTSKSISIPVVAPEIFIKFPTPISSIGSGIYNLEALLYFFNVSSMNETAIVWLANSLGAQGSGGDHSKIELDTKNIPRGTRISVELSVKNIFNNLESAKKSITFITN